MANYSIRDLANFTGVKAHTLRIWEKRYQLVEPKRTCTNIRYYTDDDLKKLLNVSILNKQGVKISNIVNLSDEAIKEHILIISLNKNKPDSQIEQLVLAMIDLDEQAFDRVFNRTVVNFGFEDTIINLIFPFFQRIGILWQIGTINPAQEHFVSNLIRQKLIVAINELDNKADNNTRLFLLFMPEGDYHELGLIFYHYLLIKHHHRVIYLGSAVPFQALVEIAKIKRVDYMLASVTNAMDDNDFRQFILRLSDDFPQVKKSFLTGLQMDKNQIPLPPNMEKIDSVLTFRSLLSSL